MSAIPLLLAIVCLILSFLTGDGEFRFAGHVYLAAYLVIASARPA